MESAVYQAAGTSAFQSIVELWWQMDGPGRRIWRHSSLVILSYSPLQSLSRHNKQCVKSINTAVTVLCTSQINTVIRGCAQSLIFIEGRWNCRMQRVVVWTHRPAPVSMLLWVTWFCLSRVIAACSGTISCLSSVWLLSDGPTHRFIISTAAVIWQLVVFH